MKGLLFSLEMARQNVAGRKCETRRLAGLESLNTEPEEWSVRKGYHGDWIATPGHPREGLKLRFVHAVRPRFRPGKVFYQKESFQVVHFWTDPETGYVEDLSVAKELPADDCGGYWTVAYKAEYPEESREERGFAWRSPLMLPARFARFFARVEEVRCERLHDITEEGARAEGCREVDTIAADGQASARTVYLSTFAQINPKAPANPWVFVYRYRAISREEAFA